MMVWKIMNAFPVKVEGPQLKASGNEVAIESIEVAHEAKLFLTELSPHGDLDAARRVLQVQEGNTSHEAQALNASRDAHLEAVFVFLACLEERRRLIDGMRATIATWVRVDTASA